MAVYKYFKFININKTRNSINILFENPKFKQSIILFGVNIITLPIGIIISIILTKLLGTHDFGNYSFINNLFNISVVIGSFGFFQAGNRAIVLCDNKIKIKEYYGTLLFITSLLSIIMSISILIYANIDYNLTNKGISYLVKLLASTSWIYLLTKYFEVLFQADNRINLLAITRFFPKIFFFIGLLIIALHNINLSSNSLLIIIIFLQLTQVIVYIYVIFKIKPLFTNIRKSFIEIWEYNKSYGLNVYVGSIFAVGFSQLSGILISYYGVDNSGVGFYSLAISFSSPLALIPNIIATTHYKEFSKQKYIPIKLTSITLAITIISYIFISLILPLFINKYYGPEYKPVIKVANIVNIGVIFYGLSDFINRFLGSHGYGVALRNSSFFVGLSLLFCNLIFIPIWKEVGAAYTYLVTGIIYFISMILYYKLSLKK